ncbi:PLC-like phosphodiesterase [Mycena olivaceomarginata]|nr:PLC-like phosphodiesterase [Mycena olivaceomarginata]
MLSLLFSLLAFTFPVLTAASTAQQLLANAALADILARGAPILGHDSGCSQSSKTCDWMRNYPDATKLVHMTLPGTHDSATWNYTQATQDSLFQYTGTYVVGFDLHSQFLRVSSDVPLAAIFQCQDKSLFDMLNLGIMFDLQFAYNPGNDTLGFHHSQALLAPTTTVEDIWFGLYSWLDQHPTEAVLISLNYVLN